MPSRTWLYFTGFVMSGLLLVGAGALALFESLSVLFGPPTDQFVLLAMVGAAAEWLLLGVVLGTLTVVFFVATIVSLLRSLSLPRNERVASLLGQVERTVPVLDQFALSKRFEPTTEDRTRKLKARYVEGEISETEFEQKMDQLMDDTVPEKTAGPTRTAFELDEESR